MIAIQEGSIEKKQLRKEIEERIKCIQKLGTHFASKLN
jgi:hypothetical protein